MTRRSIATALTSLLIGLFITVTAPAVGADGPCLVDNQGNCAQVTATIMAAVPGQNPALDTTQAYQQETGAALAAVALILTNNAFHVARVGSAVAISSTDYHAIEAPNFVP